MVQVSRGRNLIQQSCRVKHRTSPNKINPYPISGEKSVPIQFQLL